MAIAIPAVPSCRFRRPSAGANRKSSIAEPVSRCTWLIKARTERPAVSSTIVMNSSRTAS